MHMPGATHQLTSAPVQGERLGQRMRLEDALCACEDRPACLGVTLTRYVTVLGNSVSHFYLPACPGAELVDLVGELVT